MTTRNFDALFQPQAIALIGASNQPNSVGSVLARNLLEGGFAGPILAVNPHEKSIRSMLSYRSIADLPLTPDLAVVATPRGAVPQVIAELAGKGCRAAVVVTAGFGEGEGGEGHALQQRILDAARPSLLRIVGPNCLGFISPERGINASFAHLRPASGGLALVSQSGAVTAAVIDWANTRGIGFSHVVSLGDAADVDFGDLLDYIALDAATTAILLYVENVRDARKFLSAGRIAARAKPVVVIKVGRNPAGSKAARSHTGAMAGSDAVYEAAFHRAGMLRVAELSELFDAVQTLGAGLKVNGDRLAIVTNGGGLGVIAADAVVGLGGRLAELGADSLSRLDAALPATWPRANPVDILGDAGGERYRRSLEIVLSDPGQDAVLVINCPTGVADCLDAAEGAATALASSQRPMLACWTGGRAGDAANRLFAERRIPSYRTPEEAVRAFMHLARYRRHQELLMETPPADAGAGLNLARIREVIAPALAEGRSLLSEWEAKAVLAAAGIPVVHTVIAASPAEAAIRAGAFEGPAVLKILSPDISHKTDVGGVRLRLETPAAVEQAAHEMLASVRRQMPEARIAGFTVQPMITRPHAWELIAGIAEDATFGPVVLFGQGGVATEIINDRSIGLPPLNPLLARHMIETTRMSRLLAGFRQQGPADTEAVARVLVRLSQLVIEVPEIAELDINPLLADEAGIIALDARVVVRPAADRRLAIRPYPRELETTVTLPSGARQGMRPVRPEDEPLLIDLFDRSTPADRRLRFFLPLKVLPHAMAARLSQIDYDREMALVTADIDDPAGGLTGVVRLIADPERARAEFAVMVRSDQKGRGLGFALMQGILDYARATGIGEIYGDVLPENQAMLKMAAELGFRVVAHPSEQSLVRVSLQTGAAEEAAAVSSGIGYRRLGPGSGHHRT